MNRETEILLRRARALPADQRRELLQELLRTFAPGVASAGEVREAVSVYDPSGGLLAVAAFWDPEAGVWVATSKDVDGLVTEADDLEALVRKLSGMIPDLLEASGRTHDLHRSFELRAAPIPLITPEVVAAPAEVKQPKRYPSMAEFRAQLGVPMLKSNPVLDMREEEHF